MKGEALESPEKTLRRRVLGSPCKASERLLERPRPLEGPESGFGSPAGPDRPSMSRVGGLCHEFGF